VPELAKRLATLTAAQEKNGLGWLENFLTVAEFLARETRATPLAATDEQERAA
jgi:CRISPR-associated protein Cmr2